MNAVKTAASQTEGMGEDAVEQVGVVRELGYETVCGFKVAAYRETHPEHGSAYGHIYSEHWSTPNGRNPAVKVERLFTEGQLRQALAALTLTETTEAVPVAAEEGVVSVNEYAASYYFATDDGDYSPVEGERAMIEDAINGYLASHPAPEVARLREELAEANERADANAHGGFVWMERAEAAESKLADAVKALETAREVLSWLIKDTLGPDDYAPRRSYTLTVSGRAIIAAQFAARAALATEASR